LGGSRLVNRNITAGAGRTSMRLEPEVWDALREICLREGIELRDLIKTVERTATPGGRTSAVRVHVLQYFRAAATDEGHLNAGHGTTTATGPVALLSEIQVDLGSTAEPQIPVSSIPVPDSLTIENRLSDD
jgi:predicted DNA-binding ribbon-helix-helix protein